MQSKASASEGERYSCRRTLAVQQITDELGSHLADMGRSMLRPYNGLRVVDVVSRT